MRLLRGPLRLWLDIEGPGADEVAARASRDGLVIIGNKDEADLVATWHGEGGGTDRRDRVPRLSSRELEVLRLLVQGRSNAEIAASLGIGLRTARFHLEGLYSKLGVSRRGEAVREGIRLGLVRFET